MRGGGDGNRGHAFEESFTPSVGDADISPSRGEIIHSPRSPCEERTKFAANLPP